MIQTLFISLYLWLVDHQPALSARLLVLTAQWLPQPHPHFDSTSCGFTAVHHLMGGGRVRAPFIFRHTSHQSLPAASDGISPLRSPWFHFGTPVCPASQRPSRSPCRSAGNPCEGTQRRQGDENNETNSCLNVHRYCPTCTLNWDEVESQITLDSGAGYDAALAVRKCVCVSLTLCAAAPVWVLETPPPSWSRGGYGWLTRWSSGYILMERCSVIILYKGLNI